MLFTLGIMFKDCKTLISAAHRFHPQSTRVQWFKVHFNIRAHALLIYDVFSKFNCVYSGNLCLFRSRVVPILWLTRSTINQRMWR